MQLSAERRHVAFGERNLRADTGLHLFWHEQESPNFLSVPLKTAEDLARL